MSRPYVPRAYQKWSEIHKDHKGRLSGTDHRTVTQRDGLNGGTILTPWLGPDRYGPDAHRALDDGLTAARQVLDTWSLERDAVPLARALEALRLWYERTAKCWPR